MEFLEHCFSSLVIIAVRLLFVDPWSLLNNLCNKLLYTIFEFGSCSHFIDNLQESKAFISEGICDEFF